MSKQKYYVVWKGRETGIFDNWFDCSNQVKGFPGAIYKSFKTKLLAEEAFNSSSKAFIGKEIIENELTEEELLLIGEPIVESICVDGSWNTATLVAEYQGVYTKTGEIIFRQGPFEDGTNNVVEFLGIVHALAYCKKKNINLPIYSDSRNAINWVRDKQAKTLLEKTDKNMRLFELIERAVKWLKENKYENQVLKWETRVWGENLADFGRK
jgi:ribonuclease HI